MTSLLDNVIQLLNLGVGDLGRLEHIKNSLEENKTLYSSDRMYLEKLIEQHIGNQEIIEPVQEIKSEQVQDSSNDVSNYPKSKNKIKKECFSCHKKLGMLGKQVDDEEILRYGFQPPDGMSKHDKLCQSCFNIITNTQVKAKLRFKNEGKYVKELDVGKNIFGSYIPIWALIVAMNLGWRYGTLSVLTNFFVSYTLIILGVIFISEEMDIVSLYHTVLGLIMIVSSFPLHGLITWYFIKKHNARVRANKLTSS